ncbi:MAG TPA: ATP phosphoribosyltransferase [Methanoregulaceae archaeon]|nr:ATP phosphoribosyltransferase [Methanoregulaceae archaeon]HQJ87053.1 ATP phosphoribosyltransferase [Methanoregulaceae archaeon]
MENSPPSERVRLAVPNKGRIAEPIMELLEKSGLHAVGTGERRLIVRTLDPGVELLFARPIDIPAYVANGAADLGITGLDMVGERGAAVTDLLDLRFGEATLVLAVMEESPVTGVDELAGRRVATEFPNLTARFFEDRQIPVTLVPVAGACELAPHLGIADAIVDLSSSGTTLRTNRLRVVAEVLRSSTHLIGNPDSVRSKAGKVDELVLALESVVRARGQCYLMMNVNRAHLSEVEEVLPGLGGPTVMPVASHDNLVAVHAVVAESEVYSLIPRLKHAGAKDILVMSIERMIR